jgi:hypothetical protein
MPGSCYWPPTGVKAEIAERTGESRPKRTGGWTAIGTVVPRA